jgi:N-acyl homoserine lactone hydrolase
MTSEDIRTLGKTAHDQPEHRPAEGPGRGISTALGEELKVHAIQAGRLVANKTTMRGNSRWSYFRRQENFEFPAFVYIIKHPEGHIAIDTGVNAQGWSFPLPIRRIAPSSLTDREEDEIGPQMRAAGLRPEDIRIVILTHLDVDHMGGVGWFPNAKILIHRPEYEFASTVMGRTRYQPKGWPAGFAPTIYDLEPRPYGPFPQSRALGDYGDLHLVPIPGHTLGQVGVILRANDVTLFFAADHMLQQDWFVEDRVARQPDSLLSATFWLRRNRELAAETSRRIQRFTQEVPTVLLPAHDSDAPRRLEARETIQL